MAIDSTIDTDPVPAATACKFCDRELDPVTECGSDTCDWCWYGMRLQPSAWKRELKKMGKQAPRRGLGCQPVALDNGGAAIVCYDPYQSAGEAKRK